jgi:phosphatidylserine/phosphatidylglycerophosphate/cardiolipin synthase-like enzyme/membrane protein DedA with SNARE-associated domain
MIAARHSIFVVGWDLHSHTRLVGESGTADDGLPIELAPFLSALVARRPELVIHLLLWDYSIIYALERELFPRLALDLKTPQVRLCLDNRAPIGCSHHQKIVLVDDCVAYCGGLDLTIRRWDTPEHSLNNPHRVDPAGMPYRPFHDVHAGVDGNAAAAIGELVRDRWRRAECTEPAPLRRGDACWPKSVNPDFTDVNVGIARTDPCPSDGRPIREVEALFHDAIEHAQRYIYIENQFLTSQPIARHLARRLRQNSNIEALLITPGRHKNWMETRTMRNGRIRFCQTIERARVGGRCCFLYPEVMDGETTTDTMIHSKVVIVDDRFLRVGSANLNNRSMGADTECDIAIEARNERERRTIRRIRNALLGEHCGADADTVERALAETGSLLHVARSLSRNGHRLRPIDDGEPDPEEMAQYIEELADPDRPIEPRSIWQRTKENAVAIGRSNTFKFALAALLIVGLTLAWNYTPLAGYAKADAVRDLLAVVRDHPLSPLIVLGVFIGGGLISFPLIVLIAATTAVFGAWPGMLYAAIGALTSGMITYGIGRLLGREALQSCLGPKLNRIRQRVVRRGVLAVAVLRLVPVAPYTVVNLVVGACAIRPLDFFAGTLLGLTPGILIFGALGETMMRLMTEPSATEIALAGAFVVVWLAVSLGIQALVSRLGNQFHEA